MIDPTDADRWRAKLDLTRQAAEADTELQAEWREIDALRPERDAEARQMIARLRDSGDLGVFRREAGDWVQRPGPYTAFTGFGQMWLNQVVKYMAGHEADVAPVLTAALQTPAAVEEAENAFASVEEAIADIGPKGQPAPARIPYVLSLFWSTDPDDRTWPCMWASAPEMMHALGWFTSWKNSERYLTFREISLALAPGDPGRVERLMWFLKERERFVGLNPSLTRMCADAAAVLQRHVPAEGYPDEDTDKQAHSLALQLRGELQLAMTGLLPTLREATGLQLEESKLQLRTAFSKDKPYRADAYATWSLPGGMGAPGYRLWVTRSGVAMGAYAGWSGASGLDYAALARLAAEQLPQGAQFFRLRPHSSGDRLEPTGRQYPGGEVFVGYWWPGEQALDRQGLREDGAQAAQALQGLITTFADARQPPAPPLEDGAEPANDELAGELAQFKAQRPYPNERDAWHEEQRGRFAECLAPENLEVFDLEVFRQLVNGRGYGAPGAQSVLNTSINAMDASELDRFASNVREILWGDDPVEQRIDRALDADDLGMKGLGESVVLKMFAVTQPERFLPVFPSGGPNGKLAMLRRLGEAFPFVVAGRTRGQLHVEANDRLVSRLGRLLPEEPWGQAQFGYWLLRQAEQAADPERDLIAEVAEDLLVPEPFLREIGELLDDKKQVVFYGPPGTGKTYLAQRLAAALQPDAARRALVQFHPSTSYEDFFEGFRPRTDERGQLTYELRKGPLALLAEQAEEAPGIPHVLIIDEINRANLPRVFGELLFLLEYRSHSVRTLYRPDDAFELPPNLFFIGTMNTADRSIAMVDAALRRRFHFVPFMPHEGPMRDLLRRWLAKHGQPVWVANLVDGVNDELRTLLQGPHLQIGHSHFMTGALDEQRLRRVWTYNVYPMIEDQLYGRPDSLGDFTWESVLKRHGPQAPVDGETEPPGDEELDDSESQPH